MPNAVQEDNPDPVTRLFIRLTGCIRIQCSYDDTCRMISEVMMYVFYWRPGKS